MNLGGNQEELSHLLAAEVHLPIFFLWDYKYKECSPKGRGLNLHFCVFFVLEGGVEAAQGRMGARHTSNTALVSQPVLSDTRANLFVVPWKRWVCSWGGKAT